MRNPRSRNSYLPVLRARRSALSVFDAQAALKRRQEYCSPELLHCSADGALISLMNLGVCGGGGFQLRHAFSHMYSVTMKECEAQRPICKLNPRPVVSGRSPQN